MKTVFSIILLFIISLPIIAQRKSYKDVDEYVKTIKMPIITPKNLDVTAHLVADKFTPDSLKARAIFDFVASYYDYDYDMLKEGFGKATEHGLGVCWQYSQLFCDMADAVGLETRMIYGWSKSSAKDIGKINKKSYHAWNMVKINGQWRPLDCTWASGYMDNKTKEFVHQLDGAYFLTNKELFSLTHHPDSGFQYIAYSAVSLQSFYDSPWYHVPNFPREFFFKPSTAKLVDYSTSKTPSVSFEYDGEIKPATWTYADVKDKTDHDITPEIKDGVITFTFPEEIGVESFVNIRYAKKTLVTLPITN
jgi:hypothetical protein